MNSRIWSMALSALVVVSLAAQAQQQRPNGFGGLQNLAQAQPLLTKDQEEKLKLTDSQKKSVEKLDKEFGDKQGEAIKPIKESVEKLAQDRDFRAIRDILPQYREVQTKISDLRKDYDGKVKDLLTDDQKKQFEEMKKSTGGTGTRRTPGTNRRPRNNQN